MKRNEDGNVDLIAAGDRMQKRRKELHMSQEQLSALTDISPSTLSQLENGHVNVSLKNFHRIAVALGCTIDELLYGISTNDSYVEEFKGAIADCSDAEKVFLLGAVKDLRKRIKRLKK